MSKAKRAKFRLRAEETVIKRGMRDYLPTGRYAHFVPGDAVLTDARFYFEAGLAAGGRISWRSRSRGYTPSKRSASLF